MIEPRIIVTGATGKTLTDVLEEVERASVNTTAFVFWTRIEARFVNSCTEEFVIGAFRTGGALRAA